MSLTVTIEAMLAAGCTPEQILAVVQALEAQPSNGNRHAAREARLARREVRLDRKEKRLAQ